VPTLKEQGLGKIGGDAWYGILAAKGTPQPAIDKLSKAIGEALKDPALNEKLVPAATMRASRTRHLRATIERERQSFGEIIKKADIKV
jgi:tripartite-type tricarboxylate transporter receptor subunit TctC